MSTGEKLPIAVRSREEYWLCWYRLKGAGGELGNRGFNNGDILYVNFSYTSRSPLIVFLNIIGCSL